MSKWMKKRLILTIFAVALVVMGFFAGQYYLSRLYEQQVEVGYRRALSELATHLQELSMEMGKARLAISDYQCLLVSSNVRRLVYAIQSNMGELPLGEVQLERIAYLLNQVYEQTYSHVEMAQLHGQIEYISHEFQQLLVRKEREFPWVSWQEYLVASPVVPGLLQGLVSINDGLEDFRKPIRSGEIAGEEINRAQVEEVARNFCGTELDFQITNEGFGVIPTYTLEAEKADEHIILEVSKKGGKVLWMISTKEVSETKLDVDELARLGEQFLNSKGFPPVYLTDVQTLQQRVTFTFVPKRGGILHYAEPIKLQVSAEDGSILGFWGTPFYLAQSRIGEEQESAVPEVDWVLEEKVRRGVEILDQKLAVILNAREDEVLVQRLGVQYQGDYYLIYLNAQTGEEERIEQVSSPRFF